MLKTNAAHGKYIFRSRYKAPGTSASPRNDGEKYITLGRARKWRNLGPKVLSCCQLLFLPVTSQPRTSSFVMRPPSLFHIQTRNVSSSPYGRTHVWKRRQPVLPNPVVPKFPQRIIRSDGSSFTHWTTSPRSLLRLTRDVTNNPVWNTGLWADEGAMEDEANAQGRLGRFNRRFDGVGGAGSDIDWMAGSGTESTSGELVDPSEYMIKAKKTKKKGGS